MQGIFVLLLVAICISHCKAKWKELESEDDYLMLFGGDERASKAIFLGVYSEECMSSVETMAFKGANRNCPEEYLSVVRIHRQVLSPSMLQRLGIGEACSAMLHFSKDNRIDDYQITFDDDEKSLTEWINNQSRVVMQLKNNFPFDVKYFWKNEGAAGEVDSGTIQEGGSVNINSYLGHLFAVRGVGDQDGRLLTWFVADRNGQLLLDHTEGRLECYEDPATSFTQQACRNPEDALFEFAMALWYNKRVEANAYQPSLVPRMTAAGFEKHRLPEEMFRELTRFWENGQHRKNVEGMVGPCLNQHVAPSYVLHLNPHMKRRLDNTLKPMLSEWSNRTDLEQTSIYGIREYTEGASLLMHVDTVSTHVISAIVNVAQSEGAVWPLQILDHDGGLHEVPMAPGDVVYYESARLLHGREAPLRGASYANVFVHYKPREGWDFDWV